MPKYRVRIKITEDTLEEVLDMPDKLAACSQALARVRETILERLEFEISATEIKPWDPGYIE
jgi:hypothetical protein